MGPDRKTLRFASTASAPVRGLALIYDLEGFSHFFNQPDVQDYVPRFLNHISDAFNSIMTGKGQYWMAEPGQRNVDSLLSPVHEKFMGDGCLYVWTPPKNLEPGNFVLPLCNRLWNLKSRFREVLKHCADDIPVAEVPQRIRFGLAGGTIYQLERSGAVQHEYIGFCINLASRLQKYCADLGFIASARIGIPESALEKNGYTRVVATKLRGFPREVVIVDGNEFKKLDGSIRNSLFSTI